jgi:hypothetical protein
MLSKAGKMLETRLNIHVSSEKRLAMPPHRV